ncbi:MAG: XRE family transcriptional regulator [Planctomycetaceae bacterium]|jgi:transcriptional regulator with XRE-family HTH domain|nr:XRE family transcriptional regulator [Planctomycetaceae bacterium]
MPEKNKLGAKIKQLREFRQISLEELAEQSETAVDLLTQLENGELVPSLTPLVQITRALGVRLGTILDDAPLQGPVVTRADEKKEVIRFSGKVVTPQKTTLYFKPLAEGKSDRHMEPFLIDVHVPPTEELPLSSHEGEEFVYVLSGKIAVRYGQKKYELFEGDSIYYDSIVPHDLHAVNGSAKILAVVYTPY